MLLLKSLPYLLLLPSATAFGDLKPDPPSPNSWRMKFCSTSGVPMEGSRCEKASLDQPWWPTQQVCGSGPESCKEVWTAGNECNPWTWKTAEGFNSFMYTCTPNSDAYNGYMIQSHHFHSDDCSVNSSGSGEEEKLTESKRNCWSDELNIHEINVCLGDDEPTLSRDSQMMMTSCVEVIEGVKMGYYETMGVPSDAAVCSDPGALNAMGPPAGWFLNRCCMACGYELGYEFPDSWKWY